MPALRVARSANAMSNIAIRVDGLSKKYKIGVARQRHDTLRDAITEALSSVFRSNGHGRADGPQPSDTIWALKDVSFEVKHGEARRLYRSKRCWEKHSPQDPVAYHGTHYWKSRDIWTRRVAS